PGFTMEINSNGMQWKRFFFFGKSLRYREFEIAEIKYISISVPFNFSQRFVIKNNTVDHHRLLQVDLHFFILTLTVYIKTYFVPTFDGLGTVIGFHVYFIQG